MGVGKRENAIGTCKHVQKCKTTKSKEWEKGQEMHIDYDLGYIQILQTECF